MVIWGVLFVIVSPTLYIFYINILAIPLVPFPCYVRDSILLGDGIWAHLGTSTLW